MIRTRRMTLKTASLDVLDAEAAGRAALAERLNVEVPANWPPELYDAQAMDYSREQIEKHPLDSHWWFYYFTLNGRYGDKVAIGAGGYKGPPDKNHTVEIGYSLLPEYRGQGYATEAAMALVETAFRHPAVERVIAETYPHLTGSIGVLTRCGFTRVGEGSEPGVVQYAVKKSDRDH